MKLKLIFSMVLVATVSYVNANGLRLGEIQSHNSMISVSNESYSGPSSIQSNQQLENSGIKIMLGEVPPPPCPYQVLPTDDTLEMSVSRWAISAGWQRPHWKFRTMFVDNAASFCGTGGFEGAIERLMASINAVGIKVFANFYQNKVIEIVEGK